MNINLLKKVPVAIAALASSVAFAGMDMDSRVSQLESQMKQVRTQTENDNFGARTAVARPEVDGGMGFFVGIGAVYAQARLGGTEFAYTSNAAPASSLTSASFPVNGTMQDIRYSWDWGLHAVAGYNLAHDGFDIRVDYNYLNTSSSATVAAGLGGSIVALKGSAAVVTGSPTGWAQTATQGKSNFSMTMNLLDFEIGRDYFVSQYLSLRPNYGLLSAWINLKQNSNYSGGTELGVNSVYVNDESEFWGLGPDLGVDTKWFIGNGFSIFGNAKGALVYGRYNVTHKENYSGTETQRINMNGDIHKLSPMADVALGVSYDTYVDNNRQHLGLRIGYNVQYFFNQNQMLVTASDNQLEFARSNGNLGIQGVTFDAVWSF